MIRAMKVLLGLAHREDATTGELAPSLPAAEAELVAAREARDAAEAAYRGSLLAGNEADTLRLDGARREASVRIDRAEALAETLRERLADAREREAEADRVANYQAAKARADDARAALVEMYPKIAGDLVQLMEMVARAEDDVDAANANLPRGAELLARVEHTVRDIPGGANEVISEVEVELWVQVGGIKPGPFRQDNVYKTSPGRGVIQSPGRPLNDCTQVELRKFVERTTIKGTMRQSVYRLAERVVLPGFRAGEREFWKPVSSPASPDEVIRQAEAVRYHIPTPTSSPHRETVIELIPTPGAERVKELTSAANTRA